MRDSCSQGGGVDDVTVGTRRGDAVSGGGVQREWRIYDGKNWFPFEPPPALQEPVEGDGVCDRVRGTAAYVSMQYSFALEVCVCVCVFACLRVCGVCVWGWGTGRFGVFLLRFACGGSDRRLAPFPWRLLPSVPLQPLLLFLPPQPLLLLLPPLPPPPRLLLLLLLACDHW